MDVLLSLRAPLAGFFGIVHDGLEEGCADLLPLGTLPYRVDEVSVFFIALLAIPAS